MKQFLKNLNTKINQNLTLILITIIFLTSIIPIIILAIYSRPCADDFAYSAQVHDLIASGNYNILEILKEAIKVDINFYNTWQGLYSSAFILALQPGIFGEQYYFIGTWLLIILMYVCVFFFVKTIFKDILKIKKYNFLISLAIIASIIVGLPSAVEGLFWYNGTWNYMPFMFLTLVNIALLLRGLYLNDKKSIIFSTILSFIISGGNHVTAFLNILILIIYNILVIKKKRNGIFPLISAIIGFIIMYIAPGTSIRQEQLPSQGLIHTIIMGGLQCIDYLQEWHNIQWALAIVASIYLAFYIKKEANLKKENLKINPIFLILTELIIISGMLCVPFKAMGNFGSGRSLNVTWIAFMLMSCITWAYSILWISFKTNQHIEFNKYYKIILVLICLGMVYFEKSNAIKAVNEITNGTAKEFTKNYELRYTMMKETDEDTIYAPSIPYDELLRFDDVTSDVNDWRNEAWKLYYGKDIIIKN